MQVSFPNIRAQSLPFQWITLSQTVWIPFTSSKAYLFIYFLWSIGYSYSLPFKKVNTNIEHSILHLESFCPCS